MVNSSNYSNSIRYYIDLLRHRTRSLLDTSHTTFRQFARLPGHISLWLSSSGFQTAVHPSNHHHPLHTESSISVLDVTNRRRGQQCNKNTTQLNKCVGLCLGGQLRDFREANDIFESISTMGCKAAINKTGSRTECSWQQSWPLLLQRRRTLLSVDTEQLLQFLQYNYCPYQSATPPVVTVSNRDSQASPLDSSFKPTNKDITL